MDDKIRKQTKKWKTKDGRKLRICDMENDHLLNAMKFLVRAAELTRKKLVVSFLTAPYPTSDGAEMAYDREMDALADATWEDFTDPIFETMILEGLRRELHKEVEEITGTTFPVTLI